MPIPAHTTLNQKRRYRRFCKNCEERLQRFTIQCPRCGRLVLTALHLIAFPILAVLLFLSLLEAIALIDAMVNQSW